MTMQYSVAVRNARLDSVQTAIGTSPILKVISGAMPANCAASTTGNASPWYRSACQVPAASRFRCGRQCFQA